jgi:uncharacterized protein
MTPTPVQTLIERRLGASLGEIAHLCQHWKIMELAIFGSILRSDFRTDSDVDFLVTFAPEAHWHLFDVMNLQRDLEALVGRSVDLTEKVGLTNPYSKAEILRTAQVLYADQ